MAYFRNYRWDLTSTEGSFSSFLKWRSMTFLFLRNRVDFVSFLISPLYSVALFCSIPLQFTPFFYSCFSVRDTVTSLWPLVFYIVAKNLRLEALYLPWLIISVIGNSVWPQGMTAIKIQLRTVCGLYVSSHPTLTRNQTEGLSSQSLMSEISAELCFIKLQKIFLAHFVVACLLYCRTC